LQLAEHLHKSLDEVMELTTAEHTLWAAYFELKGENNG
jgi:hypothetical protein